MNKPILFFIVAVIVIGLVSTAATTTNADSKKKTIITVIDKTGKTLDDFDSKSLTKKLDKMVGQNISLTIQQPKQSKTVVGTYTILGNIPNPHPNPQPTPSVPISYNKTQIYRLGTFADTDCNSGTDQGFSLFKKYQISLLLVPGDLPYGKGLNCWTDMANKYGFSKTNTLIALGNHEYDDNIQNSVLQWQGTQNYGNKTFSNGLVNILFMDANTDLGGTQLAKIKQIAENSQSKYNIAMTHQQFAGVKSKHGMNEAFNSYDPIFQKNNISLVLQGHNHHYVNLPINDVRYLTVGIGTHDLKANMYPLDSDNFNGYKTAKQIKENGIVLLDLNKTGTNINGYFIDLSEKLIDKFVS